MVEELSQCQREKDGDRRTTQAQTENDINLSAEVTAVAHLEEPASQLAGWLNRADGAAEMYVIWVGLQLLEAYVANYCCSTWF